MPPGDPPQPAPTARYSPAARHAPPCPDRARPATARRAGDRRPAWPAAIDVGLDGGIRGRPWRLVNWLAITCQPRQRAQVGIALGRRVRRQGLAQAAAAAGNQAGAGRKQSGLGMARTQPDGRGTLARPRAIASRAPTSAGIAGRAIWLARSTSASARSISPRSASNWAARASVRGSRTRLFATSSAWRSAAARSPSSRALLPAWTAQAACSTGEFSASALQVAREPARAARRAGDPGQSRPPSSSRRAQLLGCSHQHRLQHLGRRLRLPRLQARLRPQHAQRPRRAASRWRPLPACWPRPGRPCEIRTRARTSKGRMYPPIVPPPRRSPAAPPPPRSPRSSASIARAAAAPAAAGPVAPLPARRLSTSSAAVTVSSR